MYLPLLLHRHLLSIPLKMILSHLLLPSCLKQSILLHLLRHPNQLLKLIRFPRPLLHLRHPLLTLLLPIPLKKILLRVTKREMLLSQILQIKMVLLTSHRLLLRHLLQLLTHLKMILSHLLQLTYLTKVPKKETKEILLIR